MIKPTLCKHSKRGILVFLVFLWVCMSTASADSGFVFHDGVTWDTTVDEMYIAEGVTKADANVTQNDIFDTFTRDIITDRESIDDTEYIYYGDIPVLMLTTLLKDTAVISVYEDALATYTEMYGEAIAFTADDLYVYQNIIWPGRTAVEEYTHVTAWVLDDGTLAVLFAFRGYNEMAYYNTERLLAIQEGTL